MLISESWLHEWVSTKLSAQEIGNKLTLAGLELDSINPAGPKLDNKKIVVGQIVSIESHPNADKLRICSVDIGKRKLLCIVCGALNARKGLKTAVAMVNASLPNLKVAKRSIRGIESSGMLCSTAELGLEESSDGLVELDSNAPLGIGIADYLNLQDSVFEIELTPNRGDCLSICGVAREVATLTTNKIKLRKPSKAKVTSKKSLKISLKSPTACSRYVGRAIMGIDMTARTPDWMVERLRRSGLRSINPIVDVTNYVMHELGQPMHAFDLNKIKGGIIVRMAKPNESLKLLDGSTVKLTSENLVIADKSGAIALAGIMGGDDSAISDSTHNIYLEAAYFSANSILGKARQFGMHTDASYRFERGVDSTLQVEAMERATELILQITGGQAGPISHAKDNKALPKSLLINFRKTEISRILGISVPSKKVESILLLLGMTVRKTASGWKVNPPSWRFDISAEHDLVEEIGRCYGFQNIPPRMPNSEVTLNNHIETEISPHRLRTALVQRGYHEAITYSFVNRTNQTQLLGKNSAIKLANPIADNMAVMRQSIWPGLIEALQTNLNRQEQRVRLFELGHVFHKAKNSRKSEEVQRLAGIVCGPVMPMQWGNEAQTVDFFDLKNDIEVLFDLVNKKSFLQFKSSKHNALHCGQCAEIVFNRKRIGYIGKLNPEHQNFFDLDKETYLFEIDAAPLLSSVLPEFKDISKFPSVERDLAVLVNEDVNSTDVLDIVKSVSGNLLRELQLFDVYRGKPLEKNKKSFAFSLTFQSKSSNLTSTEVDAVSGKIIKELEAKLDAQLR